MHREADFVLVGGGLQNGLVALAVRARHPTARIVMIDRGTRPGGNHTWCFHAADVAQDMRAWIEPLVVMRWDSYEVAFADHSRTLASPYACVTSDRLAAVVLDTVEFVGSTTVTEVTATRVTAGGTTFEGRVIDARGPEHRVALACGWQKFLGQELVTSAPHGVTRPILMDATLPQTDGFRFMYVLPLAPDRLLVEDTYFSDTAYLDAAHLRGEISAYAQRWPTARVEREETGVLPLPWAWPRVQATAPLVAGYAGGWFHPVTGYSFPIAARLAHAIANGGVEQLAAAHNKQLGYALCLNKLLFHWFRPAQRWNVLSRFYRLPEDVIQRFYALELTALDRARILVGRPPRGLSLRAALEAR